MMRCGAIALGSVEHRERLFRISFVLQAKKTLIQPSTGDICFASPLFRKPRKPEFSQNSGTFVSHPLCFAIEETHNSVEDRGYLFRIPCVSQAKKPLIQPRTGDIHFASPVFRKLRKSEFSRVSGIFVSHPICVASQET